MNKLRYWILALITATTYISYQKVLTRTRMDAILALSSPVKKAEVEEPTEINIRISFDDGSTHETVLPLLDVRGNSLGFNPEINHYAVLDVRKLPDNVAKRIEKIFKPTHDIIIISSDSREQPLTDVTSTINHGTPGNILWQNYIGRIKNPSDNDKPAMPGSTSFTDYCKGECIQKQ